MRIGKLLYALHQLRLLSPLGIYRLIYSVFRCGINLMTLLTFSAKNFPNRVALIDDKELLTFKELHVQSVRLATALQLQFSLKKGDKVAFLCENHASMVRAIFAVSRIGADLYLINAHISQRQFHALMEQKDFQLIICDEDWASHLEQSDHREAVIRAYGLDLPSIESLANNIGTKKVFPLPRTRMSKIVLQTGGTTGTPKEATHYASIFTYLHPFLTLVHRLKLVNYYTAYIGTPIYHGYGIAITLVLLALGRKSIISRGFQAEKACRLIQEHNAEVVTVVPVMLQRMLCYPDLLTSLKCIASGSAKLPSTLVAKTFQKLGNVLYNLYGTSEAGLTTVATPAELRNHPLTIGKRIYGIRLAVLDGKRKQVEVGSIGQLCVQSEAAARHDKTSWIETGDLGYRDKEGNYFLCGRTDDMIVSGGVNVYPAELEDALIKHPHITDVAVVGMNDEQFGQRLRAFIVVKHNEVATVEELQNWLRPHVARYQYPKEIQFVSRLPYTSIGKVDKKQLSERENEAEKTE